MLLERYGVVTRELANRDGARFAWRRLFPALRVMELAGEVVSGAFFEELSGPQFALPQAAQCFTDLATQPGAGANLWLSALDPICPSGLGLSWPGAELPHRRAGNHIALVDGEPMLLSQAGGERLRFLCAPEDPAVVRAWQLFAAGCRARGRVTLKQINDAPARSSPYLAALPAADCGLALHSDHRQCYLEPSAIA